MSLSRRQSLAALSHEEGGQSVKVYPGRLGGDLGALGGLAHVPDSQHQVLLHKVWV